jgi:hypothetical protein
MKLSFILAMYSSLDEAVLEFSKFNASYISCASSFFRTQLDLSFNVRTISSTVLGVSSAASCRQSFLSNDVRRFLR